VDFGCVAEQVVVVDALRPLAGAHLGENLGQAAMLSDINKRCAGGMVFTSAYGDGNRGTAFMVIEPAAGHAAVGNTGGNSHGRTSMSGHPGRTTPLSTVSPNGAEKLVLI
jgi:hypothetical protein